MKGMFVALALSIFSFLDGQSLWAQMVAAAKTQPKPQDPTVIAWTNEKIDSQPAQEFQFELLEKPAQRKLFRVDAKLLEQKYLARVRLQPPRYFQSVALLYPELRKLLHFGDRIVTSPSNRMPNNRAPSETLKAFLDWIPEEQRAKLDELPFFSSEDVDRGYLVLNSDPRLGQWETEFFILARNQEEAQARATTLLVLLDLGMARQVQRKLLEKHSQQAEQYRKQKEILLSAEADVALIQKETLQYVGLRTLFSLQLQQLQSDIDLTGVKAQLAACEARLKADITPEQRKQLEALQLSAETEFADCEARRAEADRLVEDATTLKQLNEQLDNARKDVNTCSNDLYKIRNALVGLQHEIDNYRPKPLADGKVIVQPVEWMP